MTSQCECNIRSTQINFLKNIEKKGLRLVVYTLHKFFFFLHWLLLVIRTFVLQHYCSS